MAWKTDQNFVVVVAGWNVSLFKQIDWIQKFINPNAKAENTNPFGVLYDFGNFMFRLNVNRLEFAPKNFEPRTLNEIEETLESLSNHLPHTPVNALGINLTIEEHLGTSNFLPNDDALEKLTLLGEPKEFFSRVKVQMSDNLLSVGIKKTEINKQPTWVDINFHYDLDTIATIKHIIHNRKLTEHLDHAEEVCADIFTKVDQEDDQN